MIRWVPTPRAMPAHRRSTNRMMLHRSAHAWLMMVIWAPAKRARRVEKIPSTGGTGPRISVLPSFPHKATRHCPATGLPQTLHKHGPATPSRKGREGEPDGPESTKAFTGWPLTLQLMYSITTWPKLSGASSMAIVMFSSMFCCLKVEQQSRSEASLGRLPPDPAFHSPLPSTGPLPNVLLDLGLSFQVKRVSGEETDPLLLAARSVLLLLHQHLSEFLWDTKHGGRGGVEIHRAVMANL